MLYIYIITMTWCICIFLKREWFRLDHRGPTRIIFRVSELACSRSLGLDGAIAWCCCWVMMVSGCTMGLVGAFGFTQQGKPCLQQSAALSVTSLSCIARLRRVATGGIATRIVLQLRPRKNPLNHDHDRAKQAWKASLNMSYIKAINWWNNLKYPLVN